MIRLQAFLEAKPLFYDEIDLERMPKVYQRIKGLLPKPKVIHIVGTNGKGTTGRFLAQALLQNGFEVGHYTSPHIMHFNERIWRNGDNVSDDLLEAKHQQLQTLLTPLEHASLSYFEYTTFLAMLAFEGCDYVVLEAGLGGEFDATNVFEKTLSLFTPVDEDHQSFLGDNLNAIARTKFHSMEKYAIIGRQKHQEVFNVFREVAEVHSCHTYTIDDFLSEGTLKEVHQVSQRYNLVGYLQENLTLALSALKFLGYEAHIEDLVKAPLFGRLTQILPNVLLDVGHNALAAQTIADVLKGQKFILIYNSYRDKDYAKIITLLKPIITYVALIKVEDVRAEQEAVLKKTIEETGLQVKNFDTIEENKQYLVFGSFSVAEAFLRYLGTLK